MNTDFSFTDLGDRLDSDVLDPSWLSNPDLSDVDYLNSKQLEIINAGNKIINLFHLLLLSGEYLKVAGNPIRIFEKIESFIDSRTKDIESLKECDQKYRLQTYFHDNVVFPFRGGLKPRIDYFLRDLDRQLKLENQQSLIRADRIQQKPGLIDDAVEHNLKLFYVLLRVACIEHFGFYYTKELLKDLLLRRVEVAGLAQANKEHKNAAEVKINFLLRKLVHRSKYSKGGHDTNFKYVYSFNQQEDQEISLSSIPLDPSLMVWDDLIQTHYGSGDEVKQQQRRRKKEIIQNGYDKLYSHSDYHGLIKIYKDDYRSIEQATNLLAQFNSNHDSPKEDDYKRYAEACTQAYLYNNVISLRCDKMENDIEKFKEVFGEIRQFQHENGVRNYHPWMRLSECMSNYIDKISTDLTQQTKFEGFTEYLALFSSTISKLEETYQWSYDKKLVPIQLTFEECQSGYMININENECVPLYFFSSFILPLDYNYQKKQIDTYLRKKRIYNDLTTVYESINYVLKNVNTVSNNMKKQERRSVEILAIFSAVALFSVGSIQIFGKDTVSGDPNVYYKFIFSFGFSLSLFVLLIWIVTRDNIKQIRLFHWAVLACLFILIFLAMKFVLN